MKEIKQLLVDTRTGTKIYNSTKDEPIKKISKNGEMAFVDWFIIGEKEEINGKYVISIIYA